MRKVEQQMIEAMRRARADAEGPIFRGGNTEVIRNHEGIFGTYNWWRRDVVKLHGNVIAEVSLDGKVLIGTGGWNTATTRSRLNAILARFAPDYRVNSVKGACVLSKMVPVPVRERNGVVPCSAMKIAEIGAELVEVSKAW